MSMPARLGVSAEVAAVVGAEDLAALEARAAAGGYDCADCGQHSALGGEPAVVIARAAGAGITWARISHARCSASRVQELPAVLPDETAITAVAAVIPHATGPRPVILAEPDHTIATAPGDGERADLVAAFLLGRGLHLLGRAGHRPPPAPGWSVTFPSPAAAMITGPGTLLYDGELIRPWLWQQAAAALGTVELLAGVTGLADLGPDDSVAALLAAAARAGRLTGGTITLPPEIQNLLVTESVSNVLTDIVRSVFCQVRST